MIFAPSVDFFTRANGRLPCIFFFPPAVWSKRRHLYVILLPCCLSLYSLRAPRGSTPGFDTKRLVLRFFPQCENPSLFGREHLLSGRLSTPSRRPGSLPCPLLLPQRSKCQFRQRFPQYSARWSRSPPSTPSSPMRNRLFLQRQTPYRRFVHLLSLDFWLKPLASRISFRVSSSDFAPRYVKPHFNNLP